jgi:hypothetical protein
VADGSDEVRRVLQLCSLLPFAVGGPAARWLALQLCPLPPFPGSRRGYSLRGRSLALMPCLEQSTKRLKAATRGAERGVGVVLQVPVARCWEWTGMTGAPRGTHHARALRCLPRDNASCALGCPVASEGG